MIPRGFAPSALTSDALEDLRERARRCRGAVLTMTTLAGSGHPGGSMSSMEMYLLLYHCARLRPEEPKWQDRDRVVVAHGHTSPGTYVALADAGFFDLDDAVAHFRQAGSPFEGHVERCVPGVEWTTGNLGQGTSAGVGMALAARRTGRGWRTFIASSDAAQNKGQVAEARRLAAKYRLTDMTVVVDLNRVQISGHTRQVMPVDVAADFMADGWRVLEADGHDLAELYEAISAAVADTDLPCAVLAHTVIGKGVSFMEDDPQYHGRAPTRDEYVRAMGELGLDPSWLDRAREMREQPIRTHPAPAPTPVLVSVSGTPRTYGKDAKTDCRSAWGSALVDIASSNAATPLAVFDCDLMESVRTEEFAKVHPDSFIECGVGEHNAAAAAGAMSVSGVLTFWGDFGVFGCDEVYNQQRLNDINLAHLKLGLTHCGLDVGEDGKTHQCLDYVAAFRDFFGWKVIVPADPNQADRAVRAMAAMPGNVVMAMGRSKLPAILSADGSPVFGEGYRFEYGRIEWVRQGTDVSLLVMGTPAGAAVAASDFLREKGVSVAVGIAACPLHLDDAALEAAAASGIVVTVEDHSVRTGLGDCVARWLATHGRAVRLVCSGVDAYASSGASTDLMREHGLDAEGIEETVGRAFKAGAPAREAAGLGAR